MFFRLRVLPVCYPLDAIQVWVSIDMVQMVEGGWLYVDGTMMWCLLMFLIRCDCFETRVQRNADGELNDSMHVTDDFDCEK